MLVLINGIANCQSEDFLDEFEKLIDNENVQLIPDKMIITQKIFWGEKGLLRKVGISKLNIEILKNICLFIIVFPQVAILFSIES